jgi:hypothetical protein
MDNVRARQLTARLTAIIAEEWSKSQFPGKAGTTDITTIRTRLQAEGEEPSPEALLEVLNYLRGKYFIDNPPGTETIKEPMWMVEQRGH